MFLSQFAVLKKTPSKTKHLNTQHMFKKILSIDLDGVIIDSLDNMKVAWKHTNQKFSLNISFKNYSRYLGLPFREILKKNHIYIKHEEIYKNYNKISLKNYKLIKVYKNIIKV